MSNAIDYTLTELAENEWKNFAVYTVENRAIPNMISGLKPVQNFYLHASIMMTRTKFDKVASVGSSVAILGYHHGEGSAQGAGQLMAATWNNNIPLIEGRGSFGTRLVQTAAAPRYTFTKLHDNFFKYFKDTDIAPKHSDPEHIPPKFYVPIIPMVLANGIKGIATGFAVSILPRDPDDLAKACVEYLKSGEIQTRPRVKFPDFTGKIWYNEEENRHYWRGSFKRKTTLQIEIDEIPYGYDRESYIEILDKLEENGKIVSYDDNCGEKGFNFDVKLKRDIEWTDEAIIREFKLQKTDTENITVIDENGKLKEYSNEIDLIKDFCKYRLGFLQSRIDKNLNEISSEIHWLEIKRMFIEAVLNDDITFKGKKKVEVIENIRLEISASEDEAERLLRINIMSLTKDMIEALEKEIASKKKELSYWNKTTTSKEFFIDLNNI